MAQRDITSYRTVTDQVAPRVEAEQKSYSGPSTVNQIVNAAADIGQHIIKAAQEAKITENYSKAALEVNQLQQQFEIDNESDPFNKDAIEGFKQNRQAIFDKYSEGISPFFMKPYQDSVRELGFKNDAEQAAWGYKQTRTNTVNSINNAMQANLSQALIDGQNFGNSDQTEFGAMLNYADSKSKLISAGDKILGPETTTQMLENYDDDYLKTVISGVSDTNPLKALRMLEDPNIQKSFRDQKHYSEMKKAVEARALKVQEVNGEREILNVLKNENSLLARSVESPISYVALQAELDKTNASKEARSYFMKVNGYTTKDGEIKLDPDEQLQFKADLYSEIAATTSKDVISSQDISALQNKIYKGMNNSSLTEDEGIKFLNQLVGPYIAKKEDSLSNYGSNGFWGFKGDDIGYGGVERMFKENIEVQPVNSKSGSVAFAQKVNNQNKVKLLDYYQSSLESAAAARNIAIGDIPNLPNKNDARKIYSDAQAQAIKLYTQEKYPELGNMEQLPNNIIPADGGKIYTGAQTGSKADGSVNTKFELKQINGMTFRVYPDGTGERVE